MSIPPPAKKIPVALCRCQNYDRQGLKKYIAHLVEATGFHVPTGMQLLLKPNLVTATCHHDLACTHPEFVAAVAEYFIDRGAVVRVGDSPATGGGLRAMDICGMAESLAGLPVEMVEFAETETKVLPSGIRVHIARHALECDALINLAKVKAHCQVRLTLAVKNYFGVVKGWHKAMAHQLHGGNGGEKFTALLVELPELLPAGLSMADGILAMHETGPMDGKEFALGLLGCSADAHAMDTTFLQLLNVDKQSCPLWQEGARRGLAGTQQEMLSFPLACPEEMLVTNFRVPPILAPTRFTLHHVIASLTGRFKVLLRTKG